MEVYDENKILGFKSRRSESRRSSILKTAVLTDIDPNQQQRRSPRKRKTKRISSRRVSFADTYQVKEFPRDSPHRPAPESEEASPEVNFQSDLEDTESLQTREPEIKGLDQLLTGAIHHQTIAQDVKELPFPHNTSDNSLQSGMGHVNPNHTITDTTDMDLTCSSTFPTGELFNQPAPDDFGEQVDEPKIDASAFLQSWSKRPSISIEEKKLYVPEKQFPDVSEPKFTTQINTSLNKYVGFCATESTSVTSNQRVSSLSETEISATVISTSKQRLPLGSISDSIAKPTAMSVLEETLNECSRSDLEDTKVDGKSFLSKIFGKFDGGNSDDKTIVFGDNEDMEETEVIFKGISFGLGNDDQENNDERYVENISDLKQTRNVMEDRTVVFSNNNDMEQTEALGNILLPSGQLGLDSTINVNKSTLFTRENDTEKTQPWIDPSSQLIKGTNSAGQLFDELKSNLSERTRHLSDDMEFTECHDGKISIKVNLQAPDFASMDGKVQDKNAVITESNADDKQTQNNIDFHGNSEKICTQKSVRKSLLQNLSEKTRIFGNNDITGAMEITSCIGGIEKSTQDALALNTDLTLRKGKKSTDVIISNDIKHTSYLASHLGVISSNMGINYGKMKLGESVSVDSLVNSDKTKIYTEDMTCGMEMTSCVGGVENKTSDLLMRNQEKTKTFSDNDQTGRMEITSCVGGLMNSNLDDLKSIEKTKIYSNDDVTCGMEMTACVGGFENSKSEVSKSAEKTKIYSNDDVTCGMEMTACVGGFENFKSVVSKSAEKTKIYSNDDVTCGMEMTACVGGFENSKSEVSKSAEKTKIYSNNDVTCGMEMTACVGGFMDSKSEVSKSAEKTKIYSGDNITCGMEMTAFVGGFENSKSVVSKSAEKTKICSNDDVTCGMEMTACVGGFENSKSEVSKSAEKTKIYSGDEITCGMEMTACVGGFKNSKSDMPAGEEKIKIHTNKDVTVGMDMISSVGGLEKQHPGSSYGVKIENIETMKNNTNKEEKSQTVQFDIVSSSLENTQHASEIQTSKTIENSVLDSDPKKVSEKFDEKATLNTSKTEIMSEVTKSVLKIDEENLTLSSLSMLKSKLYSRKSIGTCSSLESGNKEVQNSKQKDEKMECGDTEILKTTVGSHTEKIEGPCFGLKRKLYGIESLVKQRSKFRRVSEGGSIKSMKLQFDVTTSITAPVKLPQEEEEEIKSKEDVQQNNDNTTEMKLDDKGILSLSNIGQKDDIDIGITDIEPPLDLMGSTCTSHSDSSKSSCDIASETGLSYRNRTLNSTNSDPNQTLNSTRTREYSIMAEMAEKDPFKNSINQSFYNDLENNQKGPLTVEKFCHLIKMPKIIKWTSMAKKQTRRSSILPPIRLEEVKGAVEAFSIFKTQVDVYGSHYNDACQHIQNNETEVEEIEQRYSVEPPQLFKDVSSFSPEQSEQLRDKVLMLRRSVDKIGKKAWKEIKFDAHTEYHTKLKEKQEVLCGEIKLINSAAKRAKELTSDLQKCLEQADEEIAMLENLELPSLDEINEINTLTEALSKKEIEMQTREKEYSDCLKEKQNLEDKMRILEENDRRNLIEKSQEQEKRIEQQEKLDKLQVEMENIRSRLEPYSWDKEDCCMDSIDDMLGFKQKLLYHYDKTNSLVEWEIEERDSNHIDILLMDDTLLLHISKEPSNKDGTNKLLSLKLKSMLIDDAPPLLKMLHKLLHDIIDTNSLLEKYKTEADLNKLLDEVSSIVCDVKVLYKEISMLSLDFLVTVTDQHLRWEIWSLKSLRKVIVEMKFIPHKTSYTIDVGVEVVLGYIRDSDVMNQLQQIPLGLQYTTRLLNSVNLDLLTDKSVEES